MVFKALWSADADARRSSHIEPVKSLERKLLVHAGKDATVHAGVVPGGDALVPPAKARMQPERESPVVGLLEPGKDAVRRAAGRGASALGVANEVTAVGHDKVFPVARSKLAIGRFASKRLLALATSQSPVHPCRIGVAVNLGTELLEHRRDGPPGKSGCRRRRSCCAHFVKRCNRPAGQDMYGAPSTSIYSYCRDTIGHKLAEYRPFLFVLNRMSAGSGFSGA